MPKLLTVKAKPDETNEQLAARLVTEMASFFGESAAPTAEPDATPSEADTSASAQTFELEFDADMNAAFKLLMTEFGRGPGWVTNPKGTERLHEYWIHGKGAKKIRWGVKGDFDRCVREVGQEIAENNPEKLHFIKAICAVWHRDATGGSPGHAPTEGG
jgi:hypothetical protein